MTEFNSNCVYFTGYKPCKFKRPCQGCPTYAPVKVRIAIISLEALGAVLRSTCLLKPIRRQYPDAHITWVTMPNAKSLLQNNSQIDRLLTLEPANLPLLDELQFDLLLSVDKSMQAGGLAQKIHAKKKFGFGIDKNGVIVPLTKHGEYQYLVGLDDKLKFVENEKTETQQITETMGLDWKRDPYVLDLDDQELKIVEHRRRELCSEGVQGVIGYNTGCSNLYSYKKLTIEDSVSLIQKWRQRFPNYAVALLGGREDQARQQQMKAAFAHDPMVVDTPTDQGLRSGILWMAAADVVFSGDSLGMHIAIALQKPVVAWFGVSCIQEIDLYDRGVKIQAGVSCSPCWLRSCDREPKCFERVDLDRVVLATEELLPS